MNTREILANDLEVGDIFTDITPGTNGGQYKVSYKGRKVIETHPVSDIEGEEMVPFGWNKIVQIEVK